ncbi:MAG: AMP-binding protein [Mogibacterium sp.]|nr:AMP-binding protein [Mogibacterium sp.]
MRLRKPVEIQYDSIKELMEATCNKHSDRTAFIIKHKVHRSVSYEYITYEKFLNDIYAFCAYLRTQGLRNERIAITGANSYEWMVAYFAAQFDGHIAVPIDKELRKSEMEMSLRESNTTVVVYGRKLENQVLDIIGCGCGVKAAICMEQSEHKPDVRACIDECRKYVDAMKGDFVPKTPDELSVLLFTSGTTSNAKAAMLSNRNITSNVYGLTMHLVDVIKPDDVNLALLPFHHTFGSVGTTFMLSRGSTTVFCDGLKYLADNLVEYKVSVFIAVPLLFEAMYNKIIKTAEKSGKLGLLRKMIAFSNGLLKVGIDVRRKLFGSILEPLGGALRLAVVGAAPSDPEIFGFFRSIGIDTLQGYGLTETSPVLTAEKLTHQRAGSVGLPLPGVSIRIDGVDENGIGEVLAKGPNVMIGYLRDEDNEGVFTNGWFRTGDLGYIDEDGFLFLRGRKKNVIVLKNGKNVYPEELEEVLASALPDASEILVFGWQKDDDLLVSANFVFEESYIEEYGRRYLEEHGQNMTMEQRLEHCRSVGEDALKKHIYSVIAEVNTTLPPYKIIKRLLLSTEPMVKTSTGKVRRPFVIPDLCRRSDNF